MHSHLPHTDIAGYYQFITFRTFDSTDSFLAKLFKEETENSKKQLTADLHLDESQQGAYLHGEVLLYLSEFLKNKNQELYQLTAFCIMPNHVHLLVKPLKKLSVLMNNLKGSSSKAINEIMNREGTFWAQTYYDKAIRDQKHFDVVYNYIKNNPSKLIETNTTTPRFYGIYEES
jgi:putative transposase